MDYPEIYTYFDYRLFLKDVYGFKKKKNPYYSHRLFAQKAGFNTSNFLSLVINGKRNLTISSIAKVAKGFAFTKKEREYFENLVAMNQAKTHEEKDHYYQRMVMTSGFNKFHKIGKASYDYFSHWYIPIIREIVALGDRKQTPEQIAEMLNPVITPQMAQKGIDILLKLNIIRKNSDGLWEKCKEVITTGPEVGSLLAVNYHREMLRCASESMERYPSHERDISAVVLSISKDAMAELKNKLADFREHLLSFACEQKNADQVVQVNLQAFPMTFTITGVHKKER